MRGFFFFFPTDPDGDWLLCMIFHLEIPDWLIRAFGNKLTHRDGGNGDR